MNDMEYKEREGGCIFCGDGDTLENGYCFSCNETADDMGIDLEEL